ncbi:MAG: hypothetical protein EZS28_047582, partial [Streblomastix strix]
IKKTRVAEEQSRLLEQQKNEAIEKTRVAEEQSRLLEQQKNEAIKKTRVTEEQSRLLEQQKNEAIKKTRVTEEQSRLLEQQKNEAIEKTRVAEEQSRLLEQQKNEAIEKTQFAENRVLQLQLLNNELQLPCSVLQQIAEDLKKPLEGTDDEKKELIEIQDNDCKLISRTFNEKKDDIGRTRVIQSGVIEGFNNVFENYELHSITQAYSLAFVNIINNSTDEVILLIYNKKPYPGLIHLLEHTNNDIVNDSISSIFLILQTGISTSSESDPHPHYESLQQCDGIKKIFALFQKNGSKFSRDRSALCIGFLLRTHRCNNIVMLKEIYSHIKSLLNDDNAQIKENANYTFISLSQNI